MLDKFVPFGNTPMFWTRPYQKTMQLIGHCKSYDDIMIDGKVQENNFLAYYFEGDKVCAVAAQNRYKQALAVMEAINQGRMASASDIKKGIATPESIARGLKAEPGRGCQRENCC